MSVAAAVRPALVRYRWPVLFILLVAAFMDLLDTTIVNVALGTIQHDLAASYSTIQWVLAGYTLAFALLLVTGGRLGDICGRKRVFLVGIAGFTVASAACGFSPTPELLVAARVLQGAFAALMVPQLLAYTTIMFEPAERAMVFGIIGTMMGIAAVAGPLLGGILVSANPAGLGWRSIFLVNLPFGIAALLAGLLLMPESKADSARSLDIGGVLLLALATLCLLVPLVQGHDLGWPAWVLVLLALTVPATAALVAYERRRSTSGLATLLPLGLFQNASFRGGLIIAVVYFAGFIGMWLVLALYLQIGLAFDALHTGFTLVAWPAGGFVAAGPVIALTRKVGRPMLIGGMLLQAFAVAGIGLTIKVAGPAVPVWGLLPLMFAGGVGMSMVMTTLVDFALAGVPGNDAGAASGLFTAAEQFGGAIGVATFGLIFFSQLAVQTPLSLHAAEPAFRQQLATVQAADQERAVAMLSCLAAGQDGGMSGCQPVDASLQPVLEVAARSVREEVFASAATVALVSIAAGMVACAALMRTLPARAGENLH